MGDGNVFDLCHDENEIRLLTCTVSISFVEYRDSLSFTLRKQYFVVMMAQIDCVQIRTFYRKRITF